MPRVRVFLAASIDGFMAGENNDLSWLPGPDVLGGDGGYGAFMADVGCLLMGRRTLDVVSGFDGPWPYGQTPVVVATHRPLQDPAPSVHAASGPIADLVAQAKSLAGDKDVYLDGGELIRQAHDAGLIDEVTVTLVPVILGRGQPVFAGAEVRQAMTLIRCEPLGGGVVQLVWQPSR